MYFNWYMIKRKKEIMRSNSTMSMSFLEKELDTKQNHNFLGAKKFRCL
jgi:hypothetical protein